MSSAAVARNPPAKAPLPPHRARWTRPMSARSVTTVRTPVSPRRLIEANKAQRSATPDSVVSLKDKSRTVITSLEYKEFLENRKRLLKMDERLRSFQHSTSAIHKSGRKSVAADESTVMSVGNESTATSRFTASCGRPRSSFAAMPPVSVAAPSPRQSSLACSGYSNAHPRRATVAVITGPPHGQAAIGSGGSAEQYIVGKQIGQGAYATVKLGLHKDSGRKVALKIYDKYKLLDVQRRKSVRREIKLMERLQHPHVVAMVEAIDGPKQILIVMEYVGGGSLHAHLKKRTDRRLSESDARRLFAQVADGLRYCHSRHIAHRDIKLENVLLDETGNVKLIDFGFSAVVSADKRLKIFCGTPSYMAPEIVARKDYSGHAADMWAMGVLLYVMLCGCFPFKGGNDRELYRKIMKGLFLVPDHLSDASRALLARLLTVDASKRLTVDELLKDPWLTNAHAAAHVTGSHNNSVDHATVSTPSVPVIPSTVHTVVASSVQPAIVHVTSARSHTHHTTAADLDETALQKLDKLGYRREEILLQLQDSTSHLSKLYSRFVKPTVSSIPTVVTVT